MEEIKVHNMTNPQALIVKVPILKWAAGVRALVAEAEAQDIMLECISCEKLEEGEEIELSIALWGGK